MQRAAIRYAQPVTLYSFLYAFPFHRFSSMSSTFFGPTHVWFCREFQEPYFDKIDVLLTGIIGGKFQKY